MENVEGMDVDQEAQIRPELLEFIATLNAPVKSMDVWKFDFSGALDGFREAIPFINKAGFDEDDPFTLSDAASILYNSGLIYAKRVEDLRKSCHQLNEMLSNRNNNKKKNDDDDDDEAQKKAKVPRKRATHPLAMFADDRLDEADFFQNRAARENPNRERVLAKKMDKIPADKYLAEVQPRSLGLLHTEKIRQYEDTRGTKMNDWAEYQINTLKLNSEGYFPLESTHPDLYEILERFIPPVKDEDLAIIMDFDFQDQDQNDNFQHQNFGDQIPEGPQDIPDDHQNIGAGDPFENNAEPEDHVNVKKPSLGRPARPQALPNVPFKGRMSIALEKQARGLQDAEPDRGCEADYCPYKLRNKRILKPAASHAVAAEVIYYDHFFVIRPGETYYEPRFSKIFHRLRTRLRRVDPAAGSRGQKKAAEATFVSSHENEVDLLGAPMSSPFLQLDFGSGKKRSVDDSDDPGGMDFNDDINDGAQYIETDQPIESHDHTLNFDNGNGQQFDVFAEMRRQGQFVQPEDGVDDMDSGSTDSGPAVNVNLYEWERRLNRFLDVHEEQTLKFDLDSFGKDLVSDCEKEAGHNLQSVSRIVTRRTTGEVCRSFLSMLDLANKNVLEFGSPGEKVDGTIGKSTQSQGVTEIGVRIC